MIWKSGRWRKKKECLLSPQPPALFETVFTLHDLCTLLPWSLERAWSLMEIRLYLSPFGGTVISVDNLTKSSFYIKIDEVLLLIGISCSSTPTLEMTDHTTPEYINWISFAHGLTNVLCDGLRPFVTRETVTFYNNVSAAVAARPGAGPCTCTFVSRRKPNEYHDMTSCTWAKILEGSHHRNKPIWKQSDATKWTDPIQGPWEIAKLFIPDVGGRAITSAKDMDLTGILNLMYWCKHFLLIPQPLIDDLREIRNNKWGHVTKLELTDDEKATAFGTMEALLQHPSLARDRDAQKALHEIQTLKTVTDVNNFQAEILTQYKKMLEDLKNDSTQNLTVLKQLEQRLNIVEEDLEKTKDTLETKDSVYSYMNRVKNSALFFCNNLIKCTRVMPKRLLTPWLMIILLCNFSVTLLDPRSYQDGKQ